MLLLSSLLLAFVLAMAPLTAAAQEPEKETEGVNSGNYNIKQSFEFGYRFSDFTGNKAVFRTMVYLREGPRLLEHSLEMRSLNHQGWLFDNFSLHSFGYGGDPNAVSRLRMSKNKWYDFGATFRMNRNAWDYNLLANPLNPPFAVPAFPITFSLHKMDLVRRMSNYNLTLMPQSRLRLRLGYSRNTSEGPSFTTFHEGTDIMVFQDWKNTLNSYSFGVDFRMIPKTNISYDQFFHYYKDDTTWLDIPGVSPLQVPRYLSQLSTGTAFDLGIILNSYGSPPPAGALGIASPNSPCSQPVVSTATTPPTATATTCNGYVFYGRTGNVRTSYPTEQLTFQSNYFKNLDLSGRFVYSSSDNNVFGYNEGAAGRVTRPNQRIFAISGPSAAKRVSVTADFGATYHFNDKLRAVHSFHFANTRIPGFFDLSECSLFGTSLITNPAQYAGQTTIPATCAAVLTRTGITTTTGNPSHSSSSPADVVNERFSQFLGQDWKSNEIGLLYDFSKKLGGHLGYRFSTRSITHRVAEFDDLLFFPSSAQRGACAATAPTFPQCVLQSDGQSYRFTGEVENEEETASINEHSVLLGLWTRPSNRLRLSFDSEFFSADHSFTRISPRQMQRYKIRGTYKPKDWMSFGAVINILEKRNNVAEIFHRQHNRTYGFSAMFNRGDTFAFDFGYEYNDILSETNICFNLPVSLRPAGSVACPAATGATPASAVSVYKNKLNFTYFNTMWRPIKRVTTNFGYTLSSTSGSTLTLSPFSPAGTLSYNYHKPYAGFDLDMSRGFVGRVYWGYYGYNEKTPAGTFTSPRDFRGNIVTMSMRYGF
jgi:hypothetical protein